MFSVGWAAELRFRGRAEGAYCLGLEGGGESSGRNRKVHMTADRDGNTRCTRVTGRERRGKRRDSRESMTAKRDGSTGYTGVTGWERRETSGDSREH